MALRYASFNLLIFRSQSCNFQRQQFRLEVETVGGKRDASGLLALRKKSNLTLASVLTAFVVLHLRRLVVGAEGIELRPLPCEGHGLYSAIG